MDEPLEYLKKLAGSYLAEDGAAPEKVDRAVAMLAAVAGIERQQADANKLSVERKKLLDDLNESKSRKRAESRRYYVSVFTPLLSIAVLAGTLVLQTVQYRKNEIDKQEEARRQTSAAEDTRWSETLKAVSGPDKLAGSILLKGFLRSDRYKEPARETAFGLLLSATDIGIFKALFLSVLAPVSWDNLPQVLDLDRSLNTTLAGLLTMNRKGNQPLSPAEHERYEALSQSVKFVGEQTNPLFKARRPTGVELDLKAVGFWQCDLTNADLSGANLENSSFSVVTLNGSDISGVTRYSNLRWVSTAWWRASKIESGLLQYLIRNCPFKAGEPYPGGESSQEEYDRAIAKLSGRAL